MNEFKRKVYEKDFNDNIKYRLLNIKDEFLIDDLLDIIKELSKYHVDCELCNKVKDIKHSLESIRKNLYIIDSANNDIDIEVDEIESSL